MVEGCPDDDAYEVGAMSTIRLRSDGMVLEEFGWFGGILEEFVRERHCSG